MAKAKKVKRLQEFYRAAARHGGRLWLDGSQIGLRRMAGYLAENQADYWPGPPVDANPNRIRIELIAWMKENDFSRLEKPGKDLNHDRL